METKRFSLFIILLLLILIGCEDVNEDSIYFKLAICPAGWPIKNPSDAFRVIDHSTIIISITENGNYNVKNGIDREETKKLTNAEIEEVKEAIRVLNKIDIYEERIQVGGCKIAFETKKRFVIFDDGLLSKIVPEHYNKKLADAIDTIYKLSPIEKETR